MAWQIPLHIGQVAYQNFLAFIVSSMQMIESFMSERRKILRIG